MPKIILFIKYVVKDIYLAIKYGLNFREYGMTIYCGRQGSGKTMSMVEYLERMRVKYPKAIIVTNFGYVHQDRAMKKWRDLVNIRNGEDGVIFALDEIQNEFDSTKWANFPEQLLSQITQQRKQRVKIIASSQVFTRVVKQLREQCYEVVECRTLLGRWTFTRCFDADDYNSILDRPEKKLKLVRKWRHSFIQTDEIRALYDSYAVVEKLVNTEMLPRNQRGQGSFAQQ